MATELQQKTSEFLGSFSAPPAGDEARSSAWQFVSNSKTPSAKDEEYKYLPLRHLTDTSFVCSSASDEDVAKLLPDKLPGLLRFVFVNGRFAENHSDPLKAEGCSLKVGPATSSSTQHTFFSALNLSQNQESLVIDVPANAAPSLAIELIHVSAGSDSPFHNHPRVVINAETGSAVQIIERFIGDGVYFVNSVTEISIDEGASVEHTRIQEDSIDAFHVGRVAVKQAQKSVFTSNNIAFGGLLSRVDLESFLNGEHIECWMNGAYVAGGDQTMDNHTRLDHAMPNCNSFEVYKGVLGGASTGVFNGKIFVHQDAQKTDAKQTNQALLLSPTATINTKPQLEIFADDVKCTHGATVGQIREDALFYLRARGIPKSTAKAILVEAFVGEVLEKVSHEATRQQLARALHDKLSHPGMLEGA